MPVRDQLRTKASGTLLHQFLETFEFLSVGLQRMGLTKSQADRAACFTALCRDAGCSNAEAWEMTDELYPREGR